MGELFLRNCLIILQGGGAVRDLSGREETYAAFICYQLKFSVEAPGEVSSLGV